MCESPKASAKKNCSPAPPHLCALHLEGRSIKEGVVFNDDYLENTIIRGGVVHIKEGVVFNDDYLLCSRMTNCIQLLYSMMIN
jgi:hypothetical protein